MIPMPGNNKFQDNRFNSLEWSAPVYESPQEAMQAFIDFKLNSPVVGVRVIGGSPDMTVENLKWQVKSGLRNHVNFSDKQLENINLKDAFIDLKFHVQGPVVFDLQDGRSFEFYVPYTDAVRMGVDTLPKSMVHSVLHDNNFDPNRFLEGLFFGWNLNDFTVFEKNESNEVYSIGYDHPLCNGFPRHMRDYRFCIMNEDVESPLLFSKRDVHLVAQDCSSGLSFSIKWRHVPLQQAIDSCLNVPRMNLQQNAGDGWHFRFVREGENSKFMEYVLAETGICISKDDAYPLFYKVLSKYLPEFDVYAENLFTMEQYRKVIFDLRLLAQEVKNSKGDIGRATIYERLCNYWESAMSHLPEDTQVTVIGP